MTNVDPMVQLRAMISIRGLTEGGARTPLREFEGRLVAVVPRQEQFEGQPARTVIDLKFDEVVPIETVEPYPLEVAVLTIRLSNRKRSGWGVFASTLAALVPENVDIWDCIGYTMRLKLVQHQFGYNRNEVVPDPSGETNPDGTTKMVPRPIIADCWEVLSIKGLTSGPTVEADNSTAKDALKAALAVLNGKTEAEFNAAVWADPVAKSDPNLNSMLLANTFLPAMVAGGKVTKDAETGVYSVVQ